MTGSGKTSEEVAREELAPALERLRNGHDVLPFMTELIGSSEAEFVPMPESMADVFAGNGDFRAPGRGSDPIWLEIVDEAGQLFQLIVARPDADGELWVVAPRR
jgi:hypothetical protein